MSMAGQSPGLTTWRTIRLLQCFALITITIACSAEEAVVPSSDTVILKAADAEKQGSLMHKWGKWVVWCGHSICDGTYSWRFPEQGTFELLWNVGHKCAGSAPYKLTLNDKMVTEGRIPQHGSCDGCTPENIVANPNNRYGQMKDIALGRFQLRPGDRVQLWVRNDFACGISNPGAYAYYDELRAERAQ